MLKWYILLIAAGFITTTAGAQQHVVSGYLKDSLTHLPISGGSITNTTSKRSALSDKNGFFHIAAAPNDLIYLSAKDYQNDTVHYSVLFTDTITLYLSPAGNVLENITITSSYQKYRMDSIERRRDFEQLMGQRLHTVAQNHTEGFGLVINLDHFFKSNYKHQKKAEQSFERTEKRVYVDYRFNPQVVAFYTGLKGEELLNFMQRYTPTYEWLRQHPYREQLIFYLSDKLKAFHNNK